LLLFLIVLGYGVGRTIKKNMKTPIIICEFFDKVASCLAKTPEGCVYVGHYTDAQFKIFSWKSKTKTPIAKEFSEESVELYNVYVTVAEVVEYIIKAGINGSFLSPEEEVEIRSYAEQKGININEKVPNKKGKKPGRKPKLSIVVPVKTGATQPKVNQPKAAQDKKTFTGKIHRRLSLDFGETTQIIKSLLGDEEIVVGPGPVNFILIDSPREHEVGVQWLAYDQDFAKGLYGKPVSTWHQLLGYDPLAV
jgi:hypothetical protein